MMCSSDVRHDARPEHKRLSPSYHCRGAMVACKTVRQSCLMDSEMTMRSLHRMTPSIVERCSQNGWYILRVSLLSCRDGRGKQSYVGVSLVVAMRTYSS